MSRPRGQISAGFWAQCHLVVSAVGRAREAFSRRRAQIQAATGTLMIGFGLKVLSDQR